MTWLPHKEFLFDHALREALASNPQSPKGFNAKLTAHPYGINIQDTAPGWHRGCDDDTWQSLMTGVGVIAMVRRK